MKKATIEWIEQCDRFADHYIAKGQEETFMEIAVSTRAEIGERVKLLQLAAERKVMQSRWTSSTKVVHITAIEWQILRGKREAPPDVIDDARECMPDTPRSSPPPARQDAGQSSRQRAQKRRALSR